MKAAPSFLQDKEIDNLGDQRQIRLKGSLQDRHSERGDKLEISSMNAEQLPGSPDLNSSRKNNELEIKQPEPVILQNPDKLGSDLASLTEEDRINLKLVTTIQYLVIVQPITGLISACVGLALLATLELQIWEYFGVLYVGLILAVVFCLVEIRLVSRLISSDFKPAVLYNLINKVIYGCSGALLMALVASPTSSTLLIGFLATQAVHMCFYIWACWYRAKKEIDQYVGR